MGNRHCAHAWAQAALISRPPERNRKGRSVVFCLNSLFRPRFLVILSSPNTSTRNTSHTRFEFKKTKTKTTKTKSQKFTSKAFGRDLFLSSSLFDGQSKRRCVPCRRRQCSSGRAGRLGPGIGNGINACLSMKFM